MILLDCGEEEELLIGDPYLRELARGLQVALLRSGYGPVLNAARGALQTLVASEAVHGVVLAFGTERSRLAREIAERGTPCVVVTERPIEAIPGVGRVYLDLESGACEVARLFLRLGHRRIGFIGNFEDDDVRASFRRELTSAGTPLPAEWEIFAGSGREAGAAAVRRLLQLLERPTAVFARTDVMAAGALQAARAVGARVPGDLSLVGHDDLPLARAAGLTTVRIDCARLGRTVVQVLTRILEGQMESTNPPVVRTHIIERETVGPANSEASEAPPDPPA